MIQIRKSEERGSADHGWLKTFHTFSFADYYDPRFMGFSVLRVINDDYVSAGKGFGTHGHKDMEIITYVLEGSLEHKDSMGNQSIIRPGEVQRMSAGTGVQHSEFSKSTSTPTHLLQIWILPEKMNVTPGYEQKDFSDALASGKVTLVASQKGENGSISLNQDIYLYACKSQKSGEQVVSARTGRSFWIQVVSGTVSAEGAQLKAGDGAAIRETKDLILSWSENSEFLVFDLP